MPSIATDDTNKKESGRCLWESGMIEQGYASCSSSRRALRDQKNRHGASVTSRLHWSELVRLWSNLRGAKLVPGGSLEYYSCEEDNMNAVCIGVVYYTRSKAGDLMQGLTIQLASTPCAQLQSDFSTVIASISEACEKSYRAGKLAEREAYHVIEVNMVGWTTSTSQSTKVQSLGAVHSHQK